MNSAVLTIDDIASKNTPAIVDYLCEQQIQAVMFAVGANVERYYDEAIYAVGKGMIVGNHSYSHPAFSSLTIEQCVEEIERTETILNRLYQDAGVERRYRPFRFPYGDKGSENHDALQAYFREKGFHKLCDSRITYPWYTQSECHGDIDTFWTFDFAEYQIQSDPNFTKESVFKKMHEEHPGAGAVLFGENNAHILLLHAHDETEEFVPEYYKLFLNHAMECGLVFEKPVFEK